MPSTAATPDPAPAALTDDERHRLEFEKSLDDCNARRAKEGLPPLASEKIAAQWALAQEVRQMERNEQEAKAAQAPIVETKASRSAIEIIESAKNAQRAREQRQAAATATEPPTPAAPEREARAVRPWAAPAPKRDIITSFPVIPATTRAVVNEIASSALFAAIQGKDRKLVKDMPVTARGETQMFFTGELLNQDDHDVFMQLVYLASAEPLGAYVTVSAHSLLKALGRGTSGKEHQQLDAEIKRLTEATVVIKNHRATYIGHLIHDALKHEVSGQWGYRLNEKLVSLYGASCYTLIDWEQRKRLKGKDLARWLQLEIARHAVPFPLKVETLRGLSGSTAKELYHFRATLKAALAVLQADNHIAAWWIDESDLVHIDRGAALTASQRRGLALPKPGGKKA